jgi:hypothetical protein
LGANSTYTSRFFFQFFNIGRQCARVLVEVFAGAELQAVDENAGDHRVAMLTRQFHQRQVARVQVAHGGHERHAQLAAQLITQFLDGVYYFQECLRKIGAEQGYALERLYDKRT